METVAKKQIIYDYVANCLSANDKADFEAEMQINQELKQEVARLILKRLQNEQRVREHIEKVEAERIKVQKIELDKRNNISIKERIKQKWGELLDNLSSN
jgi:anti-sigma-K factor RskA